jgi:hypothetical protein
MCSGWIGLPVIMKVFKKTSPQGQLTRAQALEFTPVKSPKFKESRLGTGHVLIEYPLTVPPWISALARRMGKTLDRTRTRKLQLDALGTEVWDMVDGRRSVRQIIHLFSETHRVSTKEAEISVTRFIRELGRRGLIGLG